MDIAGLIPTFGNFFFTVAAFIVALSIIIAIHEYGHYIVGRWTGIKAEVFSIGFGPVLASRVDKHGTRWQVAALPFGGYVKFLGDGGAASNPDEEVMAGLSDDEVRVLAHAGAERHEAVHNVREACEVLNDQEHTVLAGRFGLARPGGGAARGTRRRKRAPESRLALEGRPGAANFRTVPTYFTSNSLAAQAPAALKPVVLSDLVGGPSHI